MTNTTSNTLDTTSEDLRRRVPAIRAEAEAVFAATVTVGDHSLLCLWDDETKVAYDELEDAWEALSNALQGQPATLEKARVLYHAAQSFAGRQEREGFVDGFLLGRLGVTASSMNGGLLNILGLMAEASAPAAAP